MAFLDEQLDVGYDYGQVFGPAFDTVIIAYGAGLETRHAHWDEDLGRGNLGNRRLKRSEILYLQDFFRRTKGRFKGFRFKDWGDFEGTDEYLGEGDGAETEFQLQLGQATYTKKILLPVTGTTTLKIGTGPHQTAGFTVAGTTGLVTVQANATTSISAISNASQATLNVASTAGVSVNETILITGVTGMTQINNKRVKVLQVLGSPLRFVVDLDTTGYSTYVSGGTTNTLPQTGESVYASFEFDKPVRFDTDYFPRTFEAFESTTGERFFDLQSLPIVELRQL